MNSEILTLKLFAILTLKLFCYPKSVFPKFYSIVYLPLLWFWGTTHHYCSSLIFFFKLILKYTHTLSLPHPKQQ